MEPIATAVAADPATFNRKGEAAASAVEELEDAARCNTNH